MATLIQSLQASRGIPTKSGKSYAVTARIANSAKIPAEPATKRESKKDYNSRSGWRSDNGDASPSYPGRQRDENSHGRSRDNKDGHPPNPRRWRDQSDVYPSGGQRHDSGDHRSKGGQPGEDRRSYAYEQARSRDKRQWRRTNDVSDDPKSQSRCGPRDSKWLPTLHEGGYESSSHQEGYTHQDRHQSRAHCSKQSTQTAGTKRSAAPNWRQQGPEKRSIKPDQTMLNGLNPARARAMTRRTCKEGMIILAPVHEQDYNDALPEDMRIIDEKHTYKTDFGSVYAKMRWQIVVGMREEHYITLPLYTHNGVGLRNKTPEAKREYVAIQDRRFEGEVEKLGPHRKLDAIMMPHTTVLKAESVVRLSYSINRKYDLYIEELGMLSERSLKELIPLWRAA